MSSWTRKEIAVWEALSLKVRTASDEQLSLAFEIDNVESFMEPLCEAGLTECMEISAHPMLDVSKSIAHWTPGSSAASEEQWEMIAEHCHNRLGPAEVRYTVYVATPLGAAAKGSHAVEPPRDNEMSHDLHVAQLFVQLMQHYDHGQMRSVIGEGSLEKLGRILMRFKDPDLFVVNDDGEAQTVIEFVGRYTKEHLMDLHRHLAGEAYQKLAKRFPNRKHRLYPDPNGTEYFLY